MRHVLAAVVALALAGCGGSSSSGGGGNTGQLTLPNGTIVTTAFAPGDGAALVLTDASCLMGGEVQGKLSALLLGYSSFTGLCSAVATNSMCFDKKSALLANVMVARFSLGATAPGPVGIGTYTYSATTPAPVNGIYTVVEPGVSLTDASCNDLATGSVTSATVTISTLTSARVSGTMSAAFGDGSHVSGTFDVPICSYAPPICAMMNDPNWCATGPCLP
jgi:hypothetical protein